jgi:PAS domain S-box-containing protein
MPPRESILDDAHEAVICVDGRGVVTYWNASAERMLGIAAGDALGRPVVELAVPARLRDGLQTAIRRIATEGTRLAPPGPVELVAQHADGRELPVLVTLVGGEPGADWALAAFVRDAAELPAAELPAADLLLEELRRALRASELRFEAIVGSLSDAVTIRTREHELVYANRAALEQLGFDSIEELRAAGPTQIMDDYHVLDARGQGVVMEEIPSVRILEGMPAEPLLIHIIHRRTGVHRWKLLKAAPLLDETGELQATIMIIEDVTEQQRVERDTRFLAAAGEVLASSLDYERTLRNVAELAVPDIADWCAVDLLGEEGERVSVAVAHKDPERLRLAQELRAYEPGELDPDEGLGRVLRTGEPLVYPDIPDELLVAAARDEHHLELIRAVGMRSAVVVPMRLGDRTLGAMTLVNAESGRTVGDPELALAEQLAARAAVAIENARLYTQRSRIAHTLQQSLLPRRLPEIPGYELVGAYVPAVAGTEVGGDFYDAWQVDGGWMIAIGDVTGKGVESAALTAQLRYTLRACAMFLGSPAQMLAHLDRALREPSASSLCTALCLRLDASRDELLLAVGGHPPPLRVSGDGVEMVGDYGPLIGGLRGASWRDHTLTLKPGTALVLYTDGVTDAVDEHGERFGTERLEATLRSQSGADAAALLEAVTGALAGFDHGRQADDQAILVVARTSGSAGTLSRAARATGIA